MASVPTADTRSSHSLLVRARIRWPERGDPIGTSNIRRIFIDASDRTGLKITPHDMRRFVETQLEAARWNPNWIRKVRRKTVKSEEKQYSRPKIEQLSETFQRDASYLRTTEKTPIMSREDIRREMYANLPDEYFETYAKKYGKNVQYIRNMMMLGKPIEKEKGIRTSRLEIPKFVCARDVWSARILGAFLPEVKDESPE